MIDTHFHIWDASVLTLPTLKKFEGQLEPKYTLENYMKAIEGKRIEASFYVEVDAVKEQQVKESEMVIALCEDKSNQVAGATIAGDLSDPSFEAYIQRFAKQKVVKSVRHNLFLAGSEVTRSEIFRKNTRLLGELGLMCDLVMPSENIFFGVDLAKSCPGTRFVIDHCGVCPILAEPPAKENWQKGMAAYAVLPNTICKVSECGFTSPGYRWDVSDVTGIITHCLQSFGEDRVVYGTNWPICEMTGTIQGWLDALDVTLREFPQSFYDKLFTRNAKRYYGLSIDVRS